MPTTIAAAAPLRILIVDNEASNIRWIVRVLQRLGVVTADAYDVSNAMQVALDFKPHLIISDVDMPGASGFALVRRAREELDGTPVVLMSGLVNQSRIEEAREVGALDLYEKIDLAPFLGRIVDLARAHVGGGVS